MQANKEKKQKIILHITPHLGGGVGKVLLNYFSKAKKNISFTNKIACLEYANDNAIKIIKDLGLSLRDKIYDNQSELIKMISNSDVILIHWWNHPQLFDFLVRTKLPPCRLIFWSHTSGFNPPYVFSKKSLTYPDKFIFTTPISYETKEVINLNKNQKKKLNVVWSTGGTDHVKTVKPKKHKGFNIGYIGTVDYAKLHPNFLNICNKINIPNVKFIVCGGSNEKEIKKQAEKLGILNKFEFTGIVSDINKYLSVFDLFGYPLAPYHYGTCDQVLAESMAAGIVPVVFNNKMEKYMVKNRITGIVAKNETEYIKAIKELYHNKALKDTLSKNAKSYAQTKFSLDKLVHDWDKIIKKTLKIRKTSKHWDIKKKNISPKDIFLESLGDYGTEFKNYCNAKTQKEKNKATIKIKELAKSANWQSKTKGTVHHYNTFFPNDKYLSKWSLMMK